MLAGVEVRVGLGVITRTGCREWIRSIAGVLSEAEIQWI